VHATTLFSDGGLALKIKEKYNIPYVVAVRATDIEVFLKYRKDLLFTAIKILKEAATVVFISDSLKQAFFNHRLIRPWRATFEHKCVIVYNGIDDFWLNSISPQKNTLPSSILFVGRLISRKNIVNLAMAVLHLNEKGTACEINFVGEGGKDEATIKELSQRNGGLINYLGAIKDKNILQSIYRKNHIFAMPSKGETFGLVYIEALSQGLPVLYCKNEGIDGVFDFKVGEKCDGAGISEISGKLEKIIKNYDSYELDKIDFEKFRWKKIANTYLQIYENVSSS
jgi:glycosyltransferase involved in cell wall biosynthesis